MPVSADRLRQSCRADDLVVGHAAFNGGGLAWRSPLVENRARLGINRGRILAVFLIQLENVPAVEHSEVLPPCHNSLILPYSYRSASIGSTRLALKAGTHAARSATAPSVAATATIVTGSAGRTPKRSCASARPAASRT